MVKLTAKQQQVVNLMADGWQLEHHRDSWGGRIKGWATLRKGDYDTQVSRALVKQLEDKEVVAVGERTAFDASTRVLTPLGRSLATAVQDTAKPQKWWRVMKWSTNIDSEVFANATPACLIRTNGRKVSKSSSCESWFSSRENAVAHLHQRLENAVSSAEQSLASRKRELSAFEKKEGL